MAGHNTIEIIKRNSDMVYRIAFSQAKSKDNADDIYQEVFLRYIRRKPAFENTDHEKAWFIRVTLNCSKTNLKSFWNTKVIELSEDFEDTPVDKEDLSFALNQLPKKYRAVIHLFYYEDMSIKEISDALNLSESNIRMQLTRARRKLKEILESENYI